MQCDFNDICDSSVLGKHANAYSKCFLHMCVERPWYSGVCVFTRRPPCQVYFGFVPEVCGDDIDSQGRLIRIRFKDCIIHMVYAPSKIDQNLPFLEKLHKQVLWDKAKFGLPLIVMGDINVPPTDNDISTVTPWATAGCDYSHSRAVLQGIIRDGPLIDVGSSRHTFTWFPSPTWRSQKLQIGMRLDLVLVDWLFKVESYHVNTSIRGTDDRPVTVTLQIQTDNPLSPVPHSLVPVPREVINQCAFSRTGLP